MATIKDVAARAEVSITLVSRYLNGVKGVEVMCQPEGEGFNSNYWLTCITVKPEEAGFTREDLRLTLEGDNIESRPLWKPMHLQPVFKEAPFYGDGTSDRLFEIGLCLPSGPTLTDQDIERVAKVVKQLSNFRLKDRK